MPHKILHSINDYFQFCFPKWHFQHFFTTVTTNLYYDIRKFLTILCFKKRTKLEVNEAGVWRKPLPFNLSRLYIFRYCLVWLFLCPCACTENSVWDLTLFRFSNKTFFTYIKGNNSVQKLYNLMNLCYTTKFYKK